MTPIIIPHEEIQQGTPEWLAIKLGKPSSSNFKRILKANGKPSESRSKYLKELAYERLTGRPFNTFALSAFKRGIEMEPESRTTFEEEFFFDVTQVAFVYVDARKRYGCSPDGLLYDDGGFETKDAIPEIQRERLRKNKLPSEHFHQVQGCLHVCQREYWWFRSYCRGMRPLNIKVYRDEKFIRSLRIELELFCNDLDEYVEKCRRA